MKWWPLGWQNFLGQTPPAPFQGLNTRKAFSATELRLSHFHCLDTHPDACKIFPHSWSLMPTPRHDPGPQLPHQRQSSELVVIWKETCRLRHGLPKRQSGRLQTESLWHKRRHFEMGWEAGLRVVGWGKELPTKPQELTGLFQTPLDRLCFRKQCHGVPIGLPFQPTSRSLCGPTVSLRDQSEECMCFLFRRTN